MEKLDPERRFPRRPEAEEGGCGVTGFACNIPVSGRHIFEPSVQMHNRGNGKGGGIAAVGLEASKLGVDQDTLDRDFLYQIALLDNPYCPNWRNSLSGPTSGWITRLFCPPWMTTGTCPVWKWNRRR